MTSVFNVLCSVRIETKLHSDSFTNRIIKSERRFISSTQYITKYKCNSDCLKQSHLYNLHILS